MRRTLNVHLLTFLGVWPLVSILVTALAFAHGRDVSLDGEFLLFMVVVAVFNLPITYLTGALPALATGWAAQWLSNRQLHVYLTGSTLVGGIVGLAGGLILRLQYRATEPHLYALGGGLAALVCVGLLLIGRKTPPGEGRG